MASDTAGEALNKVQTGTIRTRIPARLDRLPWSRFHWMLIAGLATAWILDGLQLTDRFGRKRLFPMETRALCIAVFYAIGTGIGGIIGPQVFSRMINTNSYEQVFFALGLGAIMMILGGVAELVFGIKAERRSLESLARPLTATGDGGAPTVGATAAS